MVQPLRSPCSIAGAVVALGLANGPVKALDIGRALSVAPQVSGAIEGRTALLAAGDGIVAEELIRTAPAGQARLRFIDATSLSIGPSSSVRLDRFVFNPSGKATSFVLDASKGVFRFVTGTSNHDAYDIETPAAVIGVRGTRFSFTVFGTHLTLTVEEGRVIVCPRGLGASACYIASAGQSVGAQPGRPVAILASAAPPPGPGPGPLEPPYPYGGPPYPYGRPDLTGPNVVPSPFPHFGPRYPYLPPTGVPPRRGRTTVGGSDQGPRAGQHRFSFGARPGLLWPRFRLR